MSVLTLQIGQCGNQVGDELFSQLASEMVHVESILHGGGLRRKSWLEDVTAQNIRNIFFHEAAGPSPAGSLCMLQPRALLVDMESKVIQGVLDASLHRAASVGWHFDREALFGQSSGSANNWAFGYHRHGPLYADAILERARRQIERMDSFQGFLCLQSVAGGTGSGLGARLCELLSSEYPRSFMTNAIVWPFSTGEVIVQNYNAVFSLSSLLRSSDAVWLFENNVLDATCRHVLRDPRPTFLSLNRVMARHLASVLLPSFHTTAAAPAEPNKHPASLAIDFKRPSLRCLAEIVASLCPHPDFKLLTSLCMPLIPAHSIDFSSYQWPLILKHLFQMAASNSPIETNIDWSGGQRGHGNSRNANIASHLILRGVAAAEGLDIMPFVRQSLQGVSADRRPVFRTDRFATLLTNGQAVVQPLDRVLRKASRTFHAGAYLYHYERFGMSLNDMRQCFVHVEQVLQSYRKLRAGDER